MSEHAEAPAATVRRMIVGFRATCLLYAAAELGLADLLDGGDKSSAELAALTATNADALHRVLRGLAQLGVVRQLGDDRFSLTPLGQCLRSGAPDSQRGLALLFGHETIWRAWGDLLHSVRTGQTAFGHVFGSTLFEYTGAHPDFVPIFNAGMVASSPAVTAALVAAYDFDRFGTIVDVGGGTGNLLTAILQASPRPHGILFDLPHSGDQAQQAIERAGLDGRCRFVGGDFFAGVPAGGDAYLLKLILHDWDDERALALLRQCRRAMAPAATLMVMEHVLPPSDQPALDAVMMDVNMLVLVGGRERSEAEYGRLFEQAGFRLRRVIATASPMSIVEGMPV